MTTRKLSFELTESQFDALVDAINLLEVELQDRVDGAESGAYAKATALANASDKLVGAWNGRAKPRRVSA